MPAKKQTRNYRYVRFPLRLLRKFLNDPKSCLYAIGIIGLIDLALRLCKENYPNQPIMEDMLITELQEFLGDQYISQLNTVGIDLKSHQLIAQLSENRYPNDNDIWPMIKIDLLIDFLGNDKNENEFEELLTYLAISSIVNENLIIKTNYNHILARMFGYKSIRDVPEAILKSDVWQNLNTRRRREKRMNAMELRWHIIKYADRSRGFYLAREEYGLENLIRFAQKNSEKYKLNQIKIAKQKALMKVLTEGEINERKVSLGSEIGWPKAN
jgi:hypothetical protein